MKHNFLNLRPTHCLCPYCGKWHKYKESTVRALKDVNIYSEPRMRLQVACAEMPTYFSQYCGCQMYFIIKETAKGEIEDFSIELSFYCDCPEQPEQLVEYTTRYTPDDNPFTVAKYSDFHVGSWDENIPSKSVVVSLKRPIITFNSSYFAVLNTQQSLSCSSKCYKHLSECAAYKLGLEEDGWCSEMQLKLGFAFDPYEYAEVMGINFPKILFDPNTDTDFYI